MGVPAPALQGMVAFGDQVSEEVVQMKEVAWALIHCDSCTSQGEEDTGPYCVPAALAQYRSLGVWELQQTDGFPAVPLP